MPYDSPKTIRRRQNAANDKAARRKSRQRIMLPSDGDWNAGLVSALARLCEQVEQGRSEAAGRQAQAIVRATLYRRALEIMRDFGRAYWKAMAMARHELYNCEI